MNKKELKSLTEVTKRIDKLERAVDKREFIKKMVNSITDIVICDNCGKVVMARIRGISWAKKGFFEVGEIDKRIANWCSKRCEKKYKNH